MTPPTTNSPGTASPTAPARLRRARAGALTAAAATALAAVAALLVGAVPGVPGVPGAPAMPWDEDPQDVPAPWEVSHPQWETLLGGDAELTAQSYTDLTEAPVDAAVPAVPEARELARAVAVADLTGGAGGTVLTYWPPSATTTTPAVPRCADVRVLGDHAAPVPTATGTWLKVLVAYSGTCRPDTSTTAPAGPADGPDAAPEGGNTSADPVVYGTTDPGVEYVYLSWTGQQWEPVRVWDVPAPAEPADDPQAQNLPEDWQLKPLGPCGIIDGDRYRARTVVADAFTAMCEAAAGDGVVLVVEGGHRTRQEQAALFGRALQHYGSEAEARRWVAYADETSCESRACAGLTVGVEPDHAALTWLRQPVACVDAAGAVTGLVDGACTAGSSAVQRSQQYGFVAPVDRIPGYLEFALPVEDSQPSPPDCTPDGVPVPNMVASIFRCRLERAGVTGATVDAVTAQAVTVSRCSSQWNPSGRVFAGRYATDVNPTDGRVYSEAGVFALRGELVETGWVRGDLTDAHANIHAAASLWLATRGWEQFPCATGTDPGLPAGPVLPAYGGPDLPDWAIQY